MIQIVHQAFSGEVEKRKCESSNRWLEIGKQVVAATTAAAAVDFAVVQLTI